MNHPISNVPIFAENGIQSIHIGVNSNCHDADLPPAFLWKHDETHTKILVLMHNKPMVITPWSAELCVYGNNVVLSGFEQAMIYHFTLGSTRSPGNSTSVIRVSKFIIYREK